MDLNHRSLSRGEPVYIAEGDLRGDRDGRPKKFDGVPMVRIHLPPAASLLLNPSFRGESHRWSTSDLAMEQSDCEF